MDWGRSYFLALLIPFFLFAFFVLFGTYFVRSGISSANILAINAIANSFDNALDQVNSICDEIILSQDFLKLKDSPDSESFSRFNLYSCTNNLRHLLTSRRSIEYCVVYSPSSDMYIGPDGWGSFQDLHNTRIFDLPLSEEEVLQLFSEHPSYMTIRDVSKDSYSGSRQHRILVTRPLSYIGTSNINDFAIAAVIDVDKLLLENNTGLTDVLIYNESEGKMLFDQAGLFDSDYVSLNFNSVDEVAPQTVGRNIVYSMSSSIRSLKYFIVIDSLILFRNMYIFAVGSASLTIVAGILAYLFVKRQINKRWDIFLDAIRESGADIDHFNCDGNIFSPFVSSVSSLKATGKSHLISRLLKEEECLVRNDELQEVGIFFPYDTFMLLLFNKPSQLDYQVLESGRQLVLEQFSIGSSIGVIINGSLSDLESFKIEFEAKFPKIAHYFSDSVKDYHKLSNIFYQVQNAMKSKKAEELQSSGYLTYQQALQIVEEFFNDQNLNVSAIADRLGCKITTLSRDFKKWHGENISDYLTLYRIEKAKEMLSENRTANEIVEACGFGSVRTFMRVFKNSEGVTPGKYRTLLTYDKTDLAHAISESVKNNKE